MNKILKILLLCLLILETGSSFLTAKRATSTQPRKSNKKKFKHRRFKQRKLHKNKRKNRRKKLPSKKSRKARRLQRNRYEELSRRQKRILENLSPDAISVNYAELKVRRMLAHSNLSKELYPRIFKRIMHALDLYETNGHVNIPDMERLVSQEILSS